jgi:diguanylate cyclase (GGDEF)-like protein/PAS domain S-box-containing protein
LTVDVSDRERMLLASHLFVKSYEGFVMLSPDLLDKIFHINPEPMSLTRLETGEYVAVNECFLLTFGYRRDEVIGKTAGDLGIWVDPERDRTQIVSHIREHGFASDCEAEFQTKAGESIRFYLGATRIEDDDGPLLLIVGRNITAIRNSEAALRSSEARHRRLIENLPLGVMIAQDGLIRYANPTSLDMIGYRLEEIADKPLLDMVVKADRQMVREFHSRRMQGDDSAFCYDLRVMRKGGEIAYWRLNSSSDLWNGTVASLVVCSDITQQKLAELRMTDLALYDQITGLPNRVLLADHARQAMAQVSKGFALIYLDLDGFKAVNDHYGHEVGDQVLKEVAKRLRSSIRETDLPARVGGDEFVVLLLNVDTCEMALQAAENLRLALNRPIRSAASEQRIGASLGISLYPVDSKDLDTLIKYADQAMYRAKRTGRNGVCCFADGRLQSD